jgi:Fic family protein
MKLMVPGDFALLEPTNGLIADVHELALKVNEFRPMSAEVVEAVHRRLLAERVYASNAIEGNTLTLRETIEVLSTGYISNRRKREGTEARNLGRAVEYLEQRLLPAASGPHTSDDFLATHRVLFEDLGARAGELRLDRRLITGAKHQPPRPELVPALVEELLQTLTSDSTTDPIKLATWAHWAIARVHPFEDGNGRMARLWQDLILLRARLAPAIIRLQDRDQNGYYDALAAADEGDLNPLAQLIAQRTAATLEQYIAAQQQVAQLSDWAAKIAGEASERAAERRRAEYLRWSRHMESIRNDFERCAARVTASGIEVQMRTYPIIDEVTWDNVRTGLGGRNTWFFKLSFQHNQGRHSYIFFFGKHFWNEADTEDDRAEPRVCVLINEQVGTEESQRLHEQEDNPIELRELFTVGNSLIAMRRKPSGRLEYERGADGVKVAMEFIEHVLLRRMS